MKKMKMVSMVVKAISRLSKKLWPVILERMKIDMRLPTIPNTPMIS